MTARSPRRRRAAFDDVQPEGPALADLRRLYAFIVVAEELHFRRAAHRLMMAQSPLSRLIRKLENDIGVTLFNRSRRSVALTPAGETLLEDVRELIERTERALARARIACDKRRLPIS